MVMQEDSPLVVVVGVLSGRHGREQRPCFPSWPCPTPYPGGTSWSFWSSWVMESSTVLLLQGISAWQAWRPWQAVSGTPRRPGPFRGCWAGMGPGASSPRPPSAAAGSESPCSETSLLLVKQRGYRGEEVQEGGVREMGS